MVGVLGVIVAPVGFGGGLSLWGYLGADGSNR